MQFTENQQQIYNQAFPVTRSYLISMSKNPDAQRLVPSLKQLAVEVDQAKQQCGCPNATVSEIATKIGESKFSHYMSAVGVHLHMDRNAANELKKLLGHEWMRFTISRPAPETSKVYIV